MDDDTTTMARIRQELDHTVTKWSDINHTSKHLTNSLFSLQKKHRSLNSQTIAYLKKCFNYALAQTKITLCSAKSKLNRLFPMPSESMKTVENGVDTKQVQIVTSTKLSEMIRQDRN